MPVMLRSGRSSAERYHGHSTLQWRSFSPEPAPSSSVALELCLPQNALRS